MCLCVEVVGLVTPTITGNHDDRRPRGLRPRRPYGLRIKNSDQSSYTTRGDVSAVLALDPFNVSPDVEIDAHLILEGESVRVAEFHFTGPESWGWNRFVVDENGMEYPRRDPPPAPRPKTFKLRGLSELLGPRR